MISWWVFAAAIVLALGALYLEYRIEREQRERERARHDAIRRALERNRL